jgi:hypothetical protein
MATMLKSFLILLFTAIFMLTLCMTAPAHAAHPLATDDTGTQGKLKFQTETTAEFGWDRENEHGITTKSSIQTLNVAVTAGIVDSIDLALSYPYIWQRIEDNAGNKLDNSGLSDLSLSLKWRFLELGSTSFAIKPYITLPTANHDRNLGAGRASYGATMISTIEVKPVTVHANIGYTNQKYTDIDEDGSREHLWSLSLAGTVEVHKGLQLVAEVGTTTNPDRRSTTWPTFMTGGVIYSAFENLDLSLGVKGGLNAPATDISLLTGVTIRFP